MDSGSRNFSSRPSVGFRDFKISPSGIGILLGTTAQDLFITLSNLFSPHLSQCKGRFRLTLVITRQATLRQPRPPPSTYNPNSDLSMHGMQACERKQTVCSTTVLFLPQYVQKVRLWLDDIMFRLLNYLLRCACMAACLS
jgi:hypothetical protein